MEEKGLLWNLKMVGPKKQDFWPKFVKNGHDFRK